MNDSPRVSVAVPVYNEESVLPEMLVRLRRVLDKIPGGPHEMVFVDDGSSDGTRTALEAAAAEDPRITVVALSRNFGHQAALTAALDYIGGDVAIVMDSDLQDTPETIPRFLEQYRKGYDAVYARRVNRKEKWWLRACYFLCYRLIARLSNPALPVDAGDFGLMSRRVVDAIRRSPEHQRYLRGLRAWVGLRQIGIEVERASRYRGSSKYNTLSLIRLAMDGVFAFSVAPLRAAAILGAIAVSLSSLFAGYSLFAKVVLDQSPQGFTALITVITFLSGVHLFFLGLIGEYIGRIYEEAKARPLYIVDYVIGQPNRQPNHAQQGTDAT